MKKVNGLFPHYVFTIFAPFKGLFQHAFFTRDILAGDLRSLKDFFRVPVIYGVNQMHGSSVWILDEEREGLVDADALITDKPGRAIMVQVADCLPVFLYDSVHHVAGMVHSGWRGTVKNVIGAALRKMRESYGTDSRDVFAGIGPSIGPCCYTRPNYSDELPVHFLQYVREGNALDLWRAGCDQLTEAGVPIGHIECARLCTKCHNDEFSSYRAEGEQARNLAAMMKLI